MKRGSRRASACGAYSLALAKITISPPGRKAGPGCLSPRPLMSPEANTFSSSLRDLKRDDISNIWAFTRQFLVDEDAFDPGIDFAYFLGRWRGDVPASDRHRIVNPGFTFMMPDGPVVSVPPIERIDYLALAALRSS